MNMLKRSGTIWFVDPDTPNMRRDDRLTARAAVKAAGLKPHQRHRSEAQGRVAMARMNDALEAAGLPPTADCREGFSLYL